MDVRDVREGRREEEAEGRGASGRMNLRGWVIVCAVSVLFVLYGFFAFYVIGDKGPPDWDFGSLPDVPGESVYSTYPYRGGAVEPEPQHVSAKPGEVRTGPGEAQKGPLPGHEQEGQEKE